MSIAVARMNVWFIDDQELDFVDWDRWAASAGPQSVRMVNRLRSRVALYHHDMQAGVATSRDLDVLRTLVREATQVRYGHFQEGGNA